MQLQARKLVADRLSSCEKFDIYQYLFLSSEKNLVDIFCFEENFSTRLQSVRRPQRIGMIKSTLSLFCISVQLR